MKSRNRLSICYAAPGQNLVPSAGPTRNVLNVANALSQWADVTVAFRNIREPVETSNYKVIAIDPNSVSRGGTADDNAARGLHPFWHMSYCQTLWSFSRQHENSYDVVLEKGWRLSGYLLNAFRRRGVPGVLIENDVRAWTDPLKNFSAVAKYTLHLAARQVAARCSRRAAVVIAETEELKSMLVEHRKLSPERIKVVGLGVDHAVFQPMDQQKARKSLKMDPDVLLILYVGAMDEYHDLEPVIESLASIPQLSVELHVVGDGEYRGRCEEKAQRAKIKARFHGHVPHALVPRYIGAADLCIAPYRTEAFHSGCLPFSTLKIPEYMACGRPVVSVPSGPIRRLVKDRVCGFLFANDVPSWRSFVKTLPSREELASMGRAAAQAVKSIGWEKTAMQYLEVCKRLAA